MPEQNKPSRNQERFLLSHAHAAGSFIRVRCNWCRVTHVYAPADLQRLAGDIPVIELDGHFRCEGCGRRDYMIVRVWNPAAAEREGQTVRRIRRVYFVRRVEWGNDAM